MFRTANAHRALPAAAVAIALATGVSGCAFVKAASPRLLPHLDEGLATSSRLFDDLSGDLSIAVESEIRVPTSLSTAISEADEALRAGATLTSEEAAALARAERWARFWTDLGDASSVLLQIEVDIPDDAIRLASLHLVNDATPEFRQIVSDLEYKVIQGLVCETAREALDSLGEQQASRETAYYDSVGDDQEDIVEYFAANLTDWTDPFDALSVYQLAADSLQQHNEYVDGILDVMESPDGTVAAANVLYFRLCVVKAE